MSASAVISNRIHLLPHPSAQPASASHPPAEQIRRRPKLKCSHPGRCTNGVYWMIDGQPYCRKHFEKFWDDHFIQDHRTVRLGGSDWG